MEQGPNNDNNSIRSNFQTKKLVADSLFNKIKYIKKGIG